MVSAHEKVRLGFFSFTEITDPNEHRAYNEWHQLDHMPEQYPLDGIVFGQRWVSTPACRAARVASDPRLDPIHYMTLYLLAAPVDRTLREFMELGAELARVGRFHQHRRAPVSGPLAVQATAAATRVLVSPAAVPYRPNRGVYVVVDDARTPTREHFAPDAAALPGVAGCWTFSQQPASDTYEWSIGETTVTVCWLDDEPLTVAPAIDALVKRGSIPLFAGPFESITPWQWDWFDT